MRRLLVLAAALLLAIPARAEVAVRSWNTPWDPGAENCDAHPHPPLEIHRFDSKTFVLRENLCATWEAPFMYLLIGNMRALLIDTGDVADARMPLAATVHELLIAQLAPHPLSRIRIVTSTIAPAISSSRVRPTTHRLSSATTSTA